MILYIQCTAHKKYDQLEQQQSFIVVSRCSEHFSLLRPSLPVAALPYLDYHLIANVKHVVRGTRNHEQLPDLKVAWKVLESDDDIF